MKPPSFHRTSRGTIRTDPIAKRILLPHEFTAFGLFISKLSHAAKDAPFRGNFNLPQQNTQGALSFVHIDSKIESAWWLTLGDLFAKVADK